MAGPLLDVHFIALICMLYILIIFYQTSINVIFFLIREVQENLVVQVLQAHLVPGVSLVSWVSLVLKEMM